VEEALSPVKLAIHLCTLDKTTRNTTNVPPEIISLEVQGPFVFVPTKVLTSKTVPIVFGVEFVDLDDFQRIVICDSTRVFKSHFNIK